jgi:NADPH-dependent 2,4-dienoyl-CoA reductase/sulfur reductase-like enzyme
VPVRPPIDGLDALGPRDGVHVLHTMGDTFALTSTLDSEPVRRALIVGAGYVGLEMAEALTARGIPVTQVEMLREVLPTVDPELGALVRAELERNGVQVLTSTTVTAVEPTTEGDGHLRVTGTGPAGPAQWDVDLVLVVVGPDMSTGLPGSGRRATAWSPTTAFWGLRTCRWGRRLTSKDAWRGRTRSGARRPSPEASAPRW